VSNKKEASRFSWAFANTAHLPSYESLRTTAVADNSQHFYDPVRGYALRRFGDHFEGVCKKRVASQKSHVLPENLVVCRFSPSQIVIVHTRKIIVNKGHGVNHFQGTRSRDSVFCGSSKQLTSGQTQRRAYPTVATRTASPQLSFAHTDTVQQRKR